MAALIKLMSSDERTFEVPVKVAKMSLTIMDLLESLVLDHDHDDPIFLPNVTGQILEKFLKWATHHQGDQSLPRDLRTGRITDWDKEFLQMGIDDLLALSQAAKYLNVEGLREITNHAIANW